MKCQRANLFPISLSIGDEIPTATSSDELSHVRWASLFRHFEVGHEVPLQGRLVYQADGGLDQITVVVVAKAVILILVIYSILIFWNNKPGLSLNMVKFALCYQNQIEHKNLSCYNVCQKFYRKFVIMFGMW